MPLSMRPSMVCVVVAMAICMEMCAMAGDSGGLNFATGDAPGTHPARATVPCVFRLPRRLLRLCGGAYRGSSGWEAPPPTGAPRGRKLALYGRSELERGGELVEGEHYSYKRRSGNVLTVREKGKTGCEHGR